jgi:MoaA/NifB/PqqE/SkfB family radical SAM enzyme
MSNFLKYEYYTVGKSPFVYVGYQCNNRCIFCFEADWQFSKKSTNQVKKEIRIIRENFDFINFMGQEPTLRKDIIELVAYAKKLGFKEIGVTTNGRMFAYPDFAKDILKSGLTQIVLTVVGHTSSMHDGHTLTKGSFDQALAGVKNILSLKKPELSFIINIMVTQRNYRDLPKTIDFYVDSGIKEINIGHVMPLNKKIIHSKGIVAPMSEVVPYLIDCQEKYDQRIRFLFVEYPACVFPREYRDKAFPCLEENPQKSRIKICQECPYQDRCTGVSQAYLNLYGQGEFKL